MNDTPNHCSQCGAVLPPDAPFGLCPACLLQQGAAADTITGEGNTTAFVPPTVPELAEKFPQLDILELIGRGGMGAVYKARQRELDRVVALKILPPGIGDAPAFAERFAREAKALAKLNHPNIVTLYEFGRADGLYFFLMEFVDGLNLRQLLHAGRVAPREALAIVPQICDALQFAHDHGIVHRDIKPENILLDRRGKVKVADFGLVKLVGAGAGATAAATGFSTDPDLTEAGKVMGTPSYMAPEQIERPGDVDHRADIYALGVIFYQLLTGELPARRLEPPSHKVHIDVRLDEVVMRALEKAPGRRYAQASVLKERVETIAAGSPARRSSWQTHPAWAVAATLMVLAVVAAFHFASGPRLAAQEPGNRSATPAQSPDHLKQDGWRLWQSGQPEAAIQKFTAALKLTPGDANTWNGLGWASFNSGHVSEAEQAFQRVVALQPGHPAALNGLGQIALAQRKYDQAEGYFLKAGPQAPAAWYGLTRLYLLQGKFKDAEKYAQMVVDTGQADAFATRMLEAARAQHLSDGLRAMIEPPPPAPPAH